MPDRMPIGRPIPDDPNERLVHEDYEHVSDDDLDNALDSAIDGKGLPDLSSAISSAVEDSEAAEEAEDEKESSVAEKQHAVVSDDMVEISEHDESLVVEDATEQETPEKESVEEPDLAERLRLLEEERNRLRIETEKRDAQLELQRAHASRLAGQIGDMKRQLSHRAQKQVESADGDYGDGNAVGGIDQVSYLEERLRQLEAATQAESVQRIIRDEVDSFDPTELDAIAEEIKEVSPKYDAEYRAIVGIGDPGLARMTVRAILRNVVADAREAKWNKQREEAQRRSTVEKERLIEKKRRAGTTTTTRAAKVTPKPKTISDLTDDELDDLIDARLA